jgi:hypothetical protein
MEKKLLALGYPTYSNYIKLPQSVLIEFNQSKDFDKINPPYYFQIESSFGTHSYCGVLDFTADEGFVLIPNSILKYMIVEGSDFVTIKYIGNIPKGDYVQIEPLDKQIFDIPELDKYLENVLSKYCLLNHGQVVDCEYNGEIYKIKIKDIKAKFEFEIPLIDIVNTDIKIDIFNKFLEEELKQKAIDKQTDKQTNKQIQGDGIKLGGVQINDRAIIREIRIQRFCENQINKPPLLKQSVKPTNKQKPKEFDV